MRKVMIGDFVEAKFEGKQIAGIITAAKVSPADMEWYVELDLTDGGQFICPASTLIDCKFVGR